PAQYPLQHNPRVRTLLETDDTMLIGTDDGLLKTNINATLDAMRFTNLSDIAEPVMPAREMIHLARCTDGKILLSSFGKGIYAFDNATDSFQPYVADDIASKQAVYSLLEGEEGDLWVVAQTALLHYDKDLQRATKPVSGSLTMIETRPLNDAHGYRWFATTDGALRLNKEYATHVSKPARAVRFTELNSHQADTTKKRLLTMADSVLRLSPDERTITLAVSALRYGEMEGIRYAWRMAGVQEEWVAFDRPNELMLHDLKPGHWVLEVRSTDGSGRWLDNVGRIGLDVAFLWHETNTARGLFGLLVIVSVLAAAWLLLRFKKLQSMYDRLLNSQLMVAVQTSMTELKPEESLTEADRQFIETLNRKIGEKIDDADFSIDELAAMFNMSRSAFYRRLKSVVGQSPVEYLKEYRLQYATELLLQDAEKTVATIAYESGFSSPQYFSNVFRKRYHMTPNEWRKRSKTA
ncbi:MAG: helix-turn-helix domain-containing protein, partial [Alistipes sp.]|nr:helix-turn-helix domain-containing protein [Alistipes sp.]